MNLVIDSSVFISHFGLSDKYTDASKLFFKHISSHNIKIIMPTLVLIETLTVLSKQKSNDIKNISKYLSAFDAAPLDMQFVRFYEKEILGKTIFLKTSDLIIATTAFTHNATLVTWDRQLLTEGIHLCRVTTPSGFLKENPEK